MKHRFHILQTRRLVIELMFKDMYEGIQIQLKTETNTLSSVAAESGHYCLNRQGLSVTLCLNRKLFLNKSCHARVPLNATFRVKLEVFFVFLPNRTQINYIIFIAIIKLW